MPSPVTGTVAAVMLIAAMFFLAYAPRGVRKRPFYAIGFVFVLLVHHVISLANAYVFTLPGAELDAASFHLQGEIYARGEWEGLTPELYIRLLGWTYRFFGASQLLGQSLSVLMLGICMVLTARIAARVDERPGPGMLLLFGLPPSVLVFASVTLREAWEAAAFLASVYAALRLRTHRGVKPLLLFAGSLAALTVLHHGLAVFAAFSAPVSLVWAYGGRVRRNRRALKRLIGILIAGVLLAVWASVAAATRNGAAAALVSGKLISAFVQFRSVAGTIDARTAFDIPLDPDRPLLLFLTLPVIFIYYLFAPFPWQIRTVADVIVFLENVLRTLLLMGAFHAWRASSGEYRARRTLALLLFFALEALWAVGTLNWGTAVRHHLPAYGLLVALGAPSLLRGARTVVGWFIGSPPKRAPRHRPHPVNTPQPL